MMRTLDPGHIYALQTFDDAGEGDVKVLTFVKRNAPPEKYPGNVDAHPGTTSQEVLRALLDRLHYVNAQQDWPENRWAMDNLRTALWLLECRAARAAGRVLTASVDDIESAPTCPRCGHVECEGH